MASIAQAPEHLKPDSWTISGNGFRVEMQSRQFRPDGRQVSFTPSPGNPVGTNGVTIDGKGAYGVWMIPPNLIQKHKSAAKCLSLIATEINRFDVWIGTKKISVPKKSYGYLLQPHIRSTSAKLLKNGSLAVKLTGADGASGWISSWTISKSGKVQTGPLIGPP